MLDPRVPVDVTPGTKTKDPVKTALDLAQPDPCPLRILPRLALLLEHVALEHIIGRGWLGVPTDARLAADPALDRWSLVDALPPARTVTARGVRADLMALRVLLRQLSIAVRGPSGAAPVPSAFADALDAAAGAVGARAMLARLLDAFESDLRARRRDLVEHLDAARSIDVRLDLWTRLDPDLRPDVLPFASTVLGLRADAAAHHRRRLGALLRDRRRIDVALAHLDAVRRGEAPPEVDPAALLEHPPAAPHRPAAPSAPPARVAPRGPTRCACAGPG